MVYGRREKQGPIQEKIRVRHKQSNSSKVNEGWGERGNKTTVRKFSFERRKRREKKNEKPRQIQITAKIKGEQQIGYLVVVLEEGLCRSKKK